MDMKFPRKYLRTLKDFILNKSTTQIDVFQKLARFIRHSNQFSKKSKIIKSSAFLPYPHLELSVFGITGLSEEEIWDIGNNVLPSNKGRGDILTIIVEKIGLNIDKNNIPPRHTNIIGWPDEKSKQKLYAEKLALAAKKAILNPNQ